MEASDLELQGTGFGQQLHELKEDLEMLELYIDFPRDWTKRQHVTLSSMLTWRI